MAQRFEPFAEPTLERPDQLIAPGGVVADHMHPDHAVGRGLDHQFHEGALVAARDGVFHRPKRRGEDAQFAQGAARVLFGLGRTRADRLPLLEVIRNVDLHDVLGESRLSADGAVVSREVKLSEPSERVLQVHAVPLRFTGEARGVVMVLHDITELRRLEQVRTEFVANVSHEIRTPLTAIHGYLETLIDGALEEPENARKFLGIVFRHTERLGRLTDDLTDLSNIELGRISLRLEPTPVAEVADSALAIIAPRASAGQVTVEAKLAADLPRVVADRDRLAQILINLVDNAVKYTPKGGRVWLEARVRERIGRSSSREP